MKKELDPEYVRSILSYNPENGEFIWRHRPDSSSNWNAKWAGKMAGTVNEKGYVKIAIFKTQYLAHRLAWVIYYGKWPNGSMDHRNGKRSDNAISNLRVASRSENAMNCRVSSSNSSGVKGVSWYDRTKKWRARISVNNEIIYLGHFEKIEEARAAREAAEIRYFGEFRRAS
jgi:hypothetical protein